MQKKYIILFFIIILAVGIAFRLYSWQHLNSLTSDEAVHSMPGVMSARIILNGFNFGYIQKFISNYRVAAAAAVFYPYGYPMFATISFLIFGFNELAARLPSMLFSILIIYAVYLLAKVIFKKEEVALWSAFFAAINPWFISWGGRALVDLPLAVFTVFSVYFLIIGIEQDKIKYWILSAICCGFAFLMKPPGILISPILALIVVYHKGFRALFQKKFIILFLIILFFFFSYFGLGILARFILPSTGLVVPNLGYKLYQSVSHWFGDALTYAEPGDPNWRTLQAWICYPELLIPQLGGLIVLILAVIGFIEMSVKENWKKTTPLALFVILIYLVFSILNNKDGRYTIAYLPFFCIFSGYGIFWIGSLYEKKFAFLIITFFIALSLISSFNMLPYENIWHTANSGLGKTAKIITQRKHGSVALNGENDMIGPNNLGFYMMLNDPKLNYFVICWLNDPQNADYIISAEDASFIEK